MLIIGHRGGGGDLPENALPALNAGLNAGIDILHVDTRMLRDGTLILLHDIDLKRTHGIDTRVRSLSYAELKELCGKNCPPKLSTVLDKYLGHVLIEIELRSDGSAEQLVNLLHSYRSRKAIENTLIASSKIAELTAARKLEPTLNLAFIQGNNPFAFVAIERSLQLAAVGFHRLHTNRLAIEIARRAGIFTYAYTANRSRSVAHLAKLDIDGIATDHPARIMREFTRYTTSEK